MSTTSSPIPEPPTYVQDPTPPVTLVLTILLLVMFFLGFFSIYFCRCFMDNLINSLNNRHTPNGTPINPTPVPLGLDPSIVNSFPTFPYSSVKDYRREKYGLECAICLCEFRDIDILRLLTICCHVFHQECIDLWFESHKSCPVCRRDLDELSMEKIASGNSARITDINNDVTNDNVGNDQVPEDAISIVIKDDTIGQESVSNREGQWVDKIQGQKPYINYEKFSRSHSTGHSILRRAPKEYDDKYKLTLPDHIKESITRKHIATLSCTTFGEYSNHSAEEHKCFGEISGCACQDVKKV